jgi:hypothetical protein
VWTVEETCRSHSKEVFRWRAMSLLERWRKAKKLICKTIKKDLEANDLAMNTIYDKIL